MREHKHIEKPEDHDWSGEVCTFKAAVADGRPVIDPSTGRITPGTIKARGTVIGQRYLGCAGVGLIPDFEIDVQCKSGAYKIGLLDNDFQPVL